MVERWHDPFKRLRIAEEKLRKLDAGIRALRPVRQELSRQRHNLTRRTSIGAEADLKVVFAKIRRVHRELTFLRRRRRSCVAIVWKWRKRIAQGKTRKPGEQEKERH